MVRFGSIVRADLCPETRRPSASAVRLIRHVRFTLDCGLRERVRPSVRGPWNVVFSAESSWPLWAQSSVLNAMPLGSVDKVPHP